MSDQQTVTAPDEMTRELTKVTSRVAEINKVEAGLAVLRAAYGGVVYEVTTTKGMDDAKAARLAIREPRYEVEKIRKAAKAPVLALGKQIDAVAARITGELEKIEAPIDLQIKNEEERKEREKQERIAAERKRVADLTARVANFQIFGSRLTPSSGSDEIGKAIASVSSVLLDNFQEFEEQAISAKGAAIERLTALRDAALDHEAAQRKLEEERAELARQREAQAERDRIAAEERRKQEAADKAARDAEAERLRKERAENDRIARERQDELDRQAEEQRAANAAEAGRIAADRAALEREQAALREAQTPKPEPVVVSVTVAAATIPAGKPRMKAVPPPDPETLVDGVARYFSVDRPTALYWLLTFRSNEVAA